MPPVDHILQAVSLPFQMCADCFLPLTLIKYITPPYRPTNRAYPVSKLSPLDHGFTDCR